MTAQLDLDRSQLERLDKETLISIILKLQEQVSELQQTVAAQAAEIQNLRDQLAKNSRNSGKCSTFPQSASRSPSIEPRSRGCL